MLKSDKAKWLQRWEKFYAGLRLPACKSCGGCGEELEGDDLVNCRECHGDGSAPPGELGTTFLAIRQEEREQFAEEIIAEHGGGPLKWLKFIGATALRQLAKEQPK